MAKIYYPKFGNFGELISYHKCNVFCRTWHFLSRATVDSHSVSWKIASNGESITHHYYTDEENDSIEQSIDDYIERQIDERIFTEAK